MTVSAEVVKNTGKVISLGGCYVVFIQKDFAAMSDLPASRTPVVEKFSLGLFLTTVALSLAGIGGLLWAFAPEAVWQAQLNAAWWQFAVIFLGMKLVNCGIEFFFHRYVLHKPVVPFLSRFYRQHTLHHSLTRIARRRLPPAITSNLPRFAGLTTSDCNRP